MGRKTFESIGRPLPGRETFVLSRTPKNIDKVHCFTNLDALDKLTTDKTIWIAGGGEIYRQMLPKCTDLYLTRVHREVEGDAHFPDFEDAFRLDSTVLKHTEFTVEHWKKI